MCKIEQIPSLVRGYYPAQLLSCNAQGRSKKNLAKSGPITCEERAALSTIPTKEAAFKESCYLPGVPNVADHRRNLVLEIRERFTADELQA